MQNDIVEIFNNTLKEQIQKLIEFEYGIKPKISVYGKAIFIFLDNKIITRIMDIKLDNIKNINTAIILAKMYSTKIVESMDNEIKDYISNKI